MSLTSSSEPHALHAAVKGMYDWNDVAVRTEQVYAAILRDRPAPASLHERITECALSALSRTAHFLQLLADLLGPRRSVLQRRDGGRARLAASSGELVPPRPSGTRPRLPARRRLGHLEALHADVLPLVCAAPLIGTYVTAIQLSPHLPSMTRGHG